MPSKYDNTFTAYIVHDDSAERNFVTNEGYGVTTARTSTDIAQSHIFFRKSKAWSVASSVNRSELAAEDSGLTAYARNYGVTPVRIKRRTPR